MIFENEDRNKFPREFVVDISIRGVNDISTLKGMPIIGLVLNETEINDISPLVGMRLLRLDLSMKKVTDISVLHGMPLRWLDISETEITDLSPLQGSQIRYLNLHHTMIDDLSPISHMYFKLTKTEDGFIQGAATMSDDFWKPPQEKGVGDFRKPRVSPKAPIKTGKE